MGLRKMSGVERKRALALAGSLLFGGEDKDGVVREVRHYLVMRGWDYKPAENRAREVYFAALANRTPGTPTGGTRP